MIKYKQGKNPNSHLRYKINENFFEIPNLLNSYWAGFIAADGNIRKNGKILKIKLSVKDLERLEKFKEDTRFEGNIGYYKQFSKKGNLSNYVELSLTSEKICCDLKNHWNIVPQKTQTYCLDLFKFSKECIDSFIVGYIDGDGTVGYYKKKNKNGRLYKYLHIIVVGTKELMLLFKKRFEEILNKKLDINITKEHKTRSFHLFRLSIQSSSDAVDLYNYFLQINVPKLNRKWNYRPKPWGYERWLSLNNKYCFKEIFIKAGHKTSLQYHRQKRETNYIQQGQAKIWLKRKEEECLVAYDAPPGSVLNVSPGDVHRIEAITNILIFEVSTPEVDDVVRLEDSYGRKGTNTP
ncbi:MAG: hypothetical protein AABY22_25560 [Nanoarchaeota archaeon]